MNPFPPHYLAAKKAVDDLSINRRVWEALRDALAGSPGPPPRVLEVGAGVGAGIERLLEWGTFHQGYITAMDIEDDLLAEARRRLPTWAAGRGLTATWRDDGALALRGLGLDVAITFEVADLIEFAARPDTVAGWDLLVANAVLDLLDFDVALPALLRLLRPGGLLYATIVFDGVTALTPPIDPELDTLIERLYHATMDSSSAHSHAGRRLIPALRAAGAVPLAAGASDWIIFAGPDGYPDQDAALLERMLGFINGALDGHPDLDPVRFANWLVGRREQIARRELVLVTHQLDVLARREA